MKQNFDKVTLEMMLGLMEGHTKKFLEPGGGIMLRHDIDDDFEKSYRLSLMEEEYGIKSTYFVLNTARYWNTPGMWPKLRDMQHMGHDIGWHNNVITEFLTSREAVSITRLINDVLTDFRCADIKINGMASHGDPLCHVHNYINYWIFRECTRENTMEWLEKHNLEQVSMNDFGIEYDAAWTARDGGIISDSGGKWSCDLVETLVEWTKPENKDKVYQILIHPQWWML